MKKLLFINIFFIGDIVAYLEKKIILRRHNLMITRMVNEVYFVITFVLHLLFGNITRSAIISRKAVEKWKIWNMGGVKKSHFGLYL